MVLAQAYVELQRRDTGAKFYVPPSYYELLKFLELWAVVVPSKNLQYHPLKKEKLSALHSKIDIYNLNCCKIEELVDVDRVKVLFDQDLTCSSEIAYIEGQLNNLSSEAPKLKVKKWEILREAEWIRKILIEVESKLKSSLDSKKTKVEQDLEKEKDHLKNLIGSVISFNNL
ncbi:hypothetical protein Cgig2_010804 [Carnegiea gigantea]|uniref:Uncharacterized protein n=1 Tax=Carnegiea gigantea TaxID=171969 RepID=A0A9Q1Q3X1_9CARY|nr:hypothetical protein Cgig2_010804 [Carnegiea gigantea]